MECRLCSDELTAYIDGELSSSSAEKIREHLEKCPPCHEELQALREAAAFVESHAREVEPVPEIWNNLRARIAEMPAPAGPPGFFQFLVVNRWAAAAATLASTAILALGLWGYMERQASQRAFESYMNDYLLMRTVTERLHAVQIRQTKHMMAEGGVARLMLSENPFVEGRSFSLANPFISEER
jgi:hypothetical protein